MMKVVSPPRGWPRGEHANSRCGLTLQIRVQRSDLFWLSYPAGVQPTSDGGEVAVSSSRGLFPCKPLRPPGCRPGGMEGERGFWPDGKQRAETHLADFDIPILRPGVPARGQSGGRATWVAD